MAATTVVKENECYVYMNGKLLHKKYIDHSQSGVTFDVMPYRKGDSLKSINDKKRLSYANKRI